MLKWTPFGEPIPKSHDLSLDFPPRVDIIKTEGTATSGWLQLWDEMGCMFSPKTRHFAQWRVFLWV